MVKHRIYYKIIGYIVIFLFGEQNAFTQVLTQTFNCTGSPQSFTIPPCVTSVTVEAWGAGGGGGGWDTYSGSNGGGGAYVLSTLAVTPGQVLTIITGCGGLPGGACASSGPGGAGGYGLGTGGSGGNSGAGGCSGPGGGGGGGSGIMNGGTILFVAGGGGGGGGGGNHGSGADGGGGGQPGNNTIGGGFAAGGTLGASGTTNGLSGITTVGDGAGGGGGGGGLNGGGGGNVPGTDYGGAGGAGGTNLGSTVINGSVITPGNSGSANLCGGCANGGTGAPNGGSAVAGGPGELILSYNNVPTPTVTANASATSVCAGNPVTLTGGGATTYTWTSGVTDGVAFTPGTTATYTVTGTSGACTDTETITVTVNALPVPVAGSNSPVCVGQAINLAGSGGMLYGWQGPGGYTVVAQNPSIPNATVAMSGTYTLTVADANNCINSATTSVTVNPLPAVTVTSNTICFGSSTTLTANGANTYSWNPATGLSSSTGTSVTAGSTTTTVYTVTGTDVNNCVNVATSTVTVNPLPVITANTATICPTFSATLNAGGANTYTWSTGAVAPSVTVSPVTTTVYTVAGTNANNCSSFVTTTVTVNPTLIVVAASNSPVCRNATLNLTANTGVVWNWNGPGGYTSNSQNPSIVNAQTNNTGTYTITATDANGCSGTATVNVTVNALPVVTAASNSPVCMHQIINLTGSAGSSYSWMGPVGYTSNQQNPTIANATIAMNGTYTLTLTDANNCVNTATTTVTVNPLPVVTVSSGTICTGGSTTLTAQGAVTFSWSPSATLSSSLGSSVTANPVSTTTYVVTGIAANTCTNTANAVVVVNPLPVVTVNSATICAGTPTILTAAGASTYSWAPPGGLSSTSGSSVTANPGAITSYVVTGTDANGCSNIASCTVTVNPLPNVKANPPTTSGCEPLCVDFSNTGTTAASCKWDFGDGKKDSLCSIKHCFNTQGTYSITLTVTDVNGCRNTSSANVTVYPLPAADFNATPQPTTILDPAIHFIDVSTSANVTQWNWNFGDNSAINPNQNPVHMYGDTGTYAVQLVVTSDFGCKDSITKYIRIDDEYIIYVPNAFTPNFDGTNDIFQPKGQGITDYRIYIYDRWGDLVFFSNDFTVGWDGRYQSKGTTIVQEDVYAWKIEIKNKKGEPRLLKGIVSLLK